MEYLLFVSDGCLSLTDWRSHYCLSKFECENSDAGWVTLLEAVHGKKIVSLRVVFNLMDEEFSSVTVPYVGLLERKALYQRRLRKEFDEPFLTAVRFQFRHRQGRRDARLLLLSLGQKTSFNSHFQALHRAGVQALSLYTLPLLAEAVLESVEQIDKNVLLLSQHRDGFRQSFYRHNRLYFSRLLEFTDAENRDEQIEREIKITTQFLLGRKWLAGGDELSIKRLSGLAESSLPDENDDVYLLASLVLSGKVKVAYFLQSPSYWQALQHRFLISLLLAATVLAPFVFVDQQLLQRAEQELSDAVLGLKNRLPAEEVISGFAWNGAQVANLVAESQRVVEQSRYSNRAVFYDLSAVLQRFPAVRVERLKWQLSAEGEPVVLHFEGTAASEYQGFLVALQKYRRFSVTEVEPLKTVSVAGVLDVVDSLPREGFGRSFTLLMQAQRDRVQ